MLSIAAKRTGKNIPVVIAELPIDDALGISLSTPNKPFFTHCQITAWFGEDSRASLKQGYRWNGADIPRFFWTLLGVSPFDTRSLIASGFHDHGTESPDIPQVMADATFVSLLRPIRFNGRRLGGVGRFRAVLMYMAVRTYSIFCRPIARWFSSLLLALVVCGGSTHAAPPALGLTVPATIKTVHDGDTATDVVIELHVQVRYLGCWARELSEPGGKEAADSAKLAEGKHGRLFIPLKDPIELWKLLTFGRILGEFWPDGSVESESERQVRLGFAGAVKKLEPAK